MKTKEIFASVFILLILMFFLVALIFSLIGGMSYMFSNMACAEEGANLEKMGVMFIDETVVCKKYENGTMTYFEIDSQKESSGKVKK